MSLSNEPATRRVADRYVPSYWKCVNWHNLLTQEGPLSGDIYNLGKIQSGKTTYLDGGHASFTGGDDFMAWNSAADPTSTAKANPDGRRLKDIVCRVNDDGVQNPEGNISYFALELTNHATGKVVTVCLGAQARSIKSQIERWGMLIERPLREIEFVGPEGDVKGKERLAEDYGPTHVHAKIGVYRKRISEFFYGGTANFERVERFWEMGKSYTKLLKEGHDIGELVRSVLPEPNSEEFDKTRAQIKEIRALDSTILGLEGLRKKLGEVQVELRKITRARDRYLRYDYASKLASLNYLNAQIRGINDAIMVTDAQLAEARKIESGTAERHTRANETLSSLRSQVDSQLLSTAADYKKRHIAQGERLADLTREEDKEAERATRLDGEHATAKNETKAAVKEFADLLQRQTAESTEDITSAGARLRRMADAAASSPAPDLVSYENAIREWRRVGDKAATALEKDRKATEDALGALRAEADALRKELLELESKKDIPPIEGLDIAIRGVEDKVVLAYRGIEPRIESDALLLEQFVGNATLAAVIPLDADGTDAIRRVVHAQCPEAKVVERKELDTLTAIPAGSILQALDPQKCHPLALAYFAHEYANVALLAPGTPRGDEPRVVWRDGQVYDGIAWQLARTQGALQFLGREAARKRIEDERARVKDLLKTNKEKTTTADDALSRIKDKESALAALSEAIELGITRLSLERRIQLIKETGSRASAQAEKVRLKREELKVARTQFDEIRKDLEFIEKRLQATDMEEKNRLLQQAIENEGELRRLHHDQGVARGRLEGTIETSRKQLESIERQLPNAKSEEQAALLALLPVAKRAGYNPADIALYVESEHIKGVTQSTIKDNRKAAENEERDAIARIGALVSEASKWRVLRHDKDPNVVVETSTGHDLDRVIAELADSISDTAKERAQKLEELTSKQIIHTVVADMKTSRDNMMRLIKRVNEVLERTPFQGSIYTIRHAKRKDDPDILRLSNLVEEFSSENQRELALFIQTHLVGVVVQPGKIPPNFDYRNWYTFKVTLERSGKESDIQQFARKASGGGKALPHYLLCFGLFNVLYNTIQAKTRLVFIDEAFRNMDAETIDDVIGFAKAMDLDLIVAAPELSGRTTRMENATVQMFTKDNATQETHVRPFLQETVAL